jgi:CheY-like chemotaxis protein
MGESCSSCQIVLGEDNPADVGLVREALREHGVDCKLHVIADGEEVMSFIDRLDLDSNTPCPDLLLLDLHLPKRDGNEILKHLRTSERCGQTPVVILTSSDAPTDHENADRNAAIHYFRKPSSLDQFMKLGIIVKSVTTRARSSRSATSQLAPPVIGTVVPNRPDTTVPPSERQQVGN